MIDPAELAANLDDPVWRLSNLYKIIAKGDDGEGRVIQFRPNRAQRRLIARLHYRNIVLKARQLGFTTLFCILWLDTALFSKDPIRCGIIAQDRDAAEVIFRDKVKFAYEHLPEALREKFPLARDSASELLFAHNGASIRVATSMRSGTIHRLHISEYGKICAKYPDKAKEVQTGSIPAVPPDGILVIESTAEGQSGDFYDKTQRAIELEEAGAKLNTKDYRLHFFPWVEAPEYALPVDGVVLSDKDREYFAEVEKLTGVKLSPEQRAWYVATLTSDFGGERQRMWQEYPSYPQEAFKVSTEGAYYAVQLAAARASGRIGLFPVVDSLPVNTFWDIGSSDGTAIWFHQRIGAENRFVRFIEGWNEPYSYFIRQMQAMGYIWGTHYLPHDAAHQRQQGHTVSSPSEELRKMGLGGKWVIVPRVDETIHGINAMREVFGQCTFDAEGCKEGLIHLASYRKQWVKQLGRWSDTPLHDTHSEAADAIRQLAQGYKAESVIERPRASARRTTDWRTGRRA